MKLKLVPGNAERAPEPVVSAPAPGTALLIDLRNFTAQLDAAVEGAALQGFCNRLADFYSLCRAAAEISTAPGGYHLTSTGDGMLCIFHGPRHGREAFLCALLLRLLIVRVFPAAEDAAGVPVSSFGIGVESGELCRVMAGGRATYIGQCINMASRLETITKSFDSADVVIGEQLVSLLYADVLKQDFPAMSAQAIDSDVKDKEHLELVSRFGRFNQALCLNFLHYHRLKGVNRPMALHGISKRAGSPGNPRFDALLGTLCRDLPHEDLLRQWLRQQLG